VISRPTQLPEVRAEMAAWMLKSGPQFFEGCIKAGKMPVRPEMGSDSACGSYLAKAEAHRLKSADLFWVDAAMTELTIAASASMPEFSLMPEDLPARSGLILFEKPIRQMESSDDFADHVYVRAATWEIVSGSMPWDVWVSWYTDSTMNVESIDLLRLAAYLGSSTSKAERDKIRIRQAMPALSYDFEEMLSFSAVPLAMRNAFTGEIMKSSAYPLKELITAWTLMQQPMVKASDAEFDRASRRRLQKAGIEPKPVRVISLRRPTSTAGERGESGREYHHKWIVRGHWRQQWYPSREVHRPVWIAPHVKGPEDAPLLGGDKVYSWTQ
jgi:hypothetical protein